ncbi:hypothetical protein [Agriterribacter sp.]|uniref:hypothetical protein n=1 Tax=Agriterribacter sp. TaxID=2821509 RepID=UPI002CB5841A|nr:hypothetical protein [Agriterribacter sp.]HRO44257.1 hypothetical protein [Agriterribacter sp.]HRQ18251.1 hypothetical protein [Agriterribacter sp.]
MMRKNFFLLTTALVLLSFSSCKKVWDYVKDHPNGTADNCSIEHLYFTQYYTNNYSIDDLPNVLFDDTASFKYNSQGQLIAIDYASTKYDLTIDVHPAIGHYFKYDTQGRLIAHIERHSIWNDPDRGNMVGGLRGHRYVYVNDNTIIDSLFSYAVAASYNDDERVYGSFSGASYITIDNFGRIVKDKNATYNYDANGNLVKPGVTYTNKTSMLQTNKTLMFISRDYSVNAPAGFATQFNSNKLPVKVNSGKLPIFTRGGLSGIYYDNENIRVKYQCR